MALAGLVRRRREGVGFDSLRLADVVYQANAFPILIAKLDLIVWHVWIFYSAASLHEALP